MSNAIKNVISLLGLAALFAIVHNDSATAAVEAPHRNVPNQQSSAAGQANVDDAIKAIESLNPKIRRDGNGAVIEVDFRGTKVTDSQLEPVQHLSRLRSLLLAGTSVTDKGLGWVKKVSTLEAIDLRDCAISDAGLKQLIGLQKLKVLKLSGKNGKCSVGDEGMESVARLKNLKVLAVDFLWVSELGIETLQPLSQLQELYMAETTIGNPALELMANFPKLKKVRLAQNQIDDLSGLAKLKNLEDVDLSQCALLTDSNMAPLKDLGKLKKLNLWRVNISDEGIKPLQGLKTLEWLNLDNTRLSDRGLQFVAGLEKLTFLHVGSTQISDAGFSKLAALKNLKDLRATRTAVTQSAVDQLQAALPKTKIQIK